MNVADARDLLRGLLRDIAPEADLDAADPRAPLQESLHLDSLGFIQLLDGLRSETGIVVPERDFLRLSSVGGFLRYLAEVSDDLGID